MAKRTTRCHQLGDAPVYISSFRLRQLYLRRLQFSCYAAIFFLLLLGVRGLWRLRPDIGQPFGGVPISWDRLNGFSVNVDVPWNWPGPQHGLRGGDRILRIDGQDPYAFFKGAFQGKQDGDSVTFEVIRHGLPSQATVPIIRFTLERFFEFYGFWFLSGISSAFASAYFIHTAADEARFVLGLSFLMITAAFLVHGYSGCINHFCFTWDVPSSVIWHYTYPIIGVLLLHFAVLFPHPPQWLVEHPWLRAIPYIWATLLGTLYLLTNWVFDRSVVDTIFYLVLLTVSSGAIAVTLRPIWSYFHPGPEGRSWSLILGSVWAVGVLLLLGVGVLPFASHGGTMMVTEILLPLCMIYPLMLVYAVYNVELVERLQQEVRIEEQYADEVSELRGIRERTLHELADELHNTIVADARGLQLWLGALRRRLLPSLKPEDVKTMTLFEQTLHKTYSDARRIMEGAKPAEFAEEGLIQPLQRLVTQSKEAGWGGVNIQFYADPCADNLYPTVTEDVYWIVRTALNNCLEHSGAAHITIRLQCLKDVLEVTVTDDGRGFSLQEFSELTDDSARRHLGVRNMQTRAKRIDGEFDIKRKTPGTVVRLVVPLPAGV